MSPRRLFPRLMSVLMLVVWTVIVAQAAGPANVAHAAVTNAWSALGNYSASYTNTIDDILVNGSDVFIAGQFTGAGGVSGLDYLAKWNGSSWGSVGSAGSINSRVNALAVIGNYLYVGGAFTNAGGVAEADGIAKFDLVGAGGWSAVGEQQPATGLGPLGGTATVTALEVDGSTLLVGGAFTDARSLVNTRHIARYTPSNTTWSSVAATFYEGASAFVASIAVVGSTTYIGLGNVSSGPSYPLMMYDNAGTFTSVSWGASWSTAKSFVGGDYPGVYALHADGTDLYVGGNFAGAGGSYGYLAKLATGTSTWSQVGDGSYCAYGSFAARCIRGITKVSGALYLQGDYGAARVNTGTNTKYDLGLGNSVSGMGSGTGAVYLGGLFTNAGGVDAADYLARFTTSTTSSLDSMSTSAGALTPAFSPGTLSYSVSTEDTTTTVTPTASNNGAGVSYSTDGGSTYTQVGTGSASPTIALSLGTNTVKVKVDPSDSAGTAAVYTTTITRTAPTTTSASTTTTSPPSPTTAPVSSSSSSSTSVVTQSTESPGTTASPQSTNATTTTAAPQVTAPATTLVSTTSPTVRVGKSVSGSSLFKSAGGTIPSGAKVAVAVASTSAKFCRVTGTSVKALKVGACKVTVTVTPKKGKATKKAIVLRVG